MLIASRTLARASAVLALLSLVSFPLAAQTVTGTMRGTVTDRSGAVLPGVTITIRNTETGLERLATTVSDGSYNAPFLPVGVYSVRAELAGLGAVTRSGVSVQLNNTTVENFALRPAVAESITVNAEAPHVDVTDGEIKQTMRSEEIMALPQGNQTSFLGLAKSFAGYQENPTSGQDNPTLSSGSSINFNGAGTRGATFQINGVNNDDSSENQNRQGVALATIRSFQVLSNSYSAEFGRGYGAVVLVQTKSGTNQLDGELYDYVQRGKWNSLDYFAPATAAHPNNHRYQFGATAGFPIIRDTLFGFLNGDAVQNAGSALQTRGTFLPSDLDPAKRLILGNDTPANRAWQDSILARWHTGAPNNPAVNARAYTAPVGFDYPQRDDSARADWNANQNNTANLRYQRSKQTYNNDEMIVGEQTFQHNHESNVGLTWTGILTANTVQEARYGLGLRSTNVDILAGNDTPIVRFSSTGVPTFTILGNAGAYPINRSQRDQQFVYNFSTARWAKHALKAGTDVRRSNLNDRADNYSRGFWTFATTCAGQSFSSSIDAFWEGCASSFWKGWASFYLQNRISEQNFYVQDDWRPTDTLTLNLGVRDERAGAPKEANDAIDYLYHNTNYVDPRLGFAYSPDWNKPWLNWITGGEGKFSIRGGYGVYHGRVFQSIFSQGGANVRFNPPNAQLRQEGPNVVFNAPFNNFNISDPTMGYNFVKGTLPSSPYSITTIDPNLKMPETRQWNLTFERQVFSQARVRLSYIGTRGVNLLQYGYDNLPISPYTPGSPWKVAADPVCAGTGQTINGVKIPTTAQCPTPVPIGDNEISLRVPRTQQRRPNQRYTTNLVVRNLGDSWYHAGQAEFETGVWHGLMTRATYTFSKAIDTGSEATFVGTGDINIMPPGDPYARLRRGLSRFDTRHRLTLNTIYAIPFFQNRNDWVKGVFGGWQFSAAFRYASPTPFTIVDTGAVDFDFDGVVVQRPVAVDPKYAGGITVNDPNQSQSQMPLNAFRHAVVGDSPDALVGRNTYFAGGIKNVDAGLYKTFGFVKNTSAMLRLDVFNVFNHPTFWFPNNDIASFTAGKSNFGKLNSTNYTPRTMQVGLRLIY